MAQPQTFNCGITIPTGTLSTYKMPNSPRYIRHDIIVWYSRMKNHLLVMAYGLMVVLPVADRSSVDELFSCACRRQWPWDGSPVSWRRTRLFPAGRRRSGPKVKSSKLTVNQFVTKNKMIDNVVVVVTTTTRSTKASYIPSPIPAPINMASS